jgi:hypothetical protein
MEEVMKKQGWFLLGLFLLFFNGINVCNGFGSATMNLEKARKVIEKSDANSCFLIGGFTLLHKSDRSLVNAQIAEKVGEEDNQFFDGTFYTKIELVNREKAKRYKIDLKPITGCEHGYYRNQKELERNTADPYWVLEVPPGSYELDTIACNYRLAKDGYYDYQSTLFQGPLSRVLHQRITFQANSGQIIYMGDYQCLLATYIYWSLDLICPLFKTNIKLDNNFENVKNLLLNTNDNFKKKLDRFELISIL